MISVVLVEPEVPGNVGAVARVMANFDFNRLILVKPNCNFLSDEARNRAKWANRILKSARVVKDFRQLREEFDYIIGTTGRLGSDYNISRTPLSPELLGQKIRSLPKSKKVAVVFGREGNGLTNDEIEACDFISSISTSKKYHSLNLSQAVGVFLYEISRWLGTDTITEGFIPADRNDRDQLIKMFNSALDTLVFPTPQKKETQRIVWRRVLEKAILTKRESRALMGFFSQLARQRKGPHR